MLEHSASAPNPPHRGRPEPHIEEPLFDLDPDFDVSAAHCEHTCNRMQASR
jgi:hypothetical protein